MSIGAIPSSIYCRVYLCGDVPSVFRDRDFSYSSSPSVSSHNSSKAQIVQSSSPSPRLLESCYSYPIVLVNVSHTAFLLSPCYPYRLSFSVGLVIPLTLRRFASRKATSKKVIPPRFRQSVYLAEGDSQLLYHNSMFNNAKPLERVSVIKNLKSIAV